MKKQNKTIQQKEIYLKKLSFYLADWLNEEKNRLAEIGIYDREIESEDIWQAIGSFNGGAR